MYIEELVDSFFGVAHFISSKCWLRHLNWPCGHFYRIFVAECLLIWIVLFCMDFRKNRALMFGFTHAGHVFLSLNLHFLITQHSSLDCLFWSDFLILGCSGGFFDSSRAAFNSSSILLVWFSPDPRAILGYSRGYLAILAIILIFR